MRKLLSLLLTLLICTSTIGQTNKLGQQMIQAGEICISGSRKATDCEVLQKTAEVLGRPVIGELATLLKERRLDLKDSLRREATIALLEEAENRFGKNSVEAVWCRFYATDAFTSLYPAEALRDLWARSGRRTCPSRSKRREEETAFPGLAAVFLRF